jgi:23S rRNA (uridine2552-2'-O)-methyltransferase
MSNQWIRAHKHDEYYKRSKAEGYRSRAAYKLKQINNKFKLIGSGNIVLDLGCAPGGWSQVAAELVGDKGKVIGIDLEPVNKYKNVIFLIGDITDPHTEEMLKEQLDGKLVDVIISDAAPNISGNYSVDQARSVFLAESALALAQQFLKGNGNFVVKVFEGADFHEFNKLVKKYFRKTKNYSPAASRSRSSEVYIIAKGFRKQ